MAKLNLKQIIDRLNMEFTGDTRKLVFWYDDNGEFAEDMKDIELENARVLLSGIRIISFIQSIFWNGWIPPLII